MQVDLFNLYEELFCMKNFHTNYYNENHSASHPLHILRIRQAHFGYKFRKAEEQHLLLDVISCIKYIN